MTAANSSGATTAGAAQKTWFPYWHPNPGARLRLFCFPYAGGTASVFHRWARSGTWPNVDVIAVQYPGHETRLQEPLSRRVPALVEALGPVIRPLLDRPFAFLGYSLGTYVSLELAHWLQYTGAPLPLGLMLAAASPPHLRRSQELYTLLDEEFIAELKRYGGTPAQVLAHRELMELLLPVLRADFEMADEYRRDPEPRLSLPFTIWGGTEDADVAPPALLGWRDLTTHDFTLHLLPGGHFFLLSEGDKLREGVERTLRYWATKGT
ncbi:thioesterase II family protein [Hyalangium rubrum]|uniref:Alpha/beta fold hydrolase n=1 Tax=Hyalangium rubrum TaxID=3103134 RepID=A0ABU5H7S1_9BACT|nr:thioesterase domain-containing protein [Hyalangium sp. s54d21]MDY7229488.1 alpha/beta fold hydrolase [Hyalangium sp. s54d21]